MCESVRRKLGHTKVPTLADSRFFKNFLYQGGVKSTVSWIYENLKFKILEGYNQNWSEPSEILKLRSSTTPKTVAFTPPWYQTWWNPYTANISVVIITIIHRVHIPIVIWLQSVLWMVVILITVHGLQFPLFEDLKFSDFSDCSLYCHRL